MTETYTDPGALVNWSTPQCPFAIEYSRKALDDIRLAVVDAFFSLPRGGAEIGGVLLGRFANQLLHIADYAPLECEHAFGPAFTLSAKDQARLAELLAETRNRPDGLQPVGWYHSHTRSEIALCDTDLEIHNRYFPESWQVALVLRPSTLHPTRAGFFFREQDGAIHTGGSYREFTVDALQVGRLPAAAPEAAPGPVRETEADAVVITLPARTPPADTVIAQPEPPLAPQPEAVDWQPEQAPTAAPSAPPVAAVSETAFESHAAAEPPEAFRPFVVTHSDDNGHATPASGETDRWPRDRAAQEAAQEEESGEAESPSHAADVAEDAEDRPRVPRRWLGIAAGIAVGLALGAAADHFRAPSVAPAPKPAKTVRAARPVPPPPAPVPQDAALRKQNQDLVKQMAALTQQNDGLRQQNATLTQQSAALTQQNSALSQQKAGAGKQQADLNRQEAQLRQERDDLAKQTAKLKADLTAETSRAQSLEQQLEDVRRQFQRRRLAAQNADPLPN